MEDFQPQLLEGADNGKIQSTRMVLPIMGHLKTEEAFIFSGLFNTQEKYGSQRLCLSRWRHVDTVANSVLYGAPSAC